MTNRNPDSAAEGINYASEAVSEKLGDLRAVERNPKKAVDGTVDTGAATIHHETNAARAVLDTADQLTDQAERNIHAVVGTTHRALDESISKADTALEHGRDFTLAGETHVRSSLYRNRRTIVAILATSILVVVGGLLLAVGHEQAAQRRPSRRLLRTLARLL